MFRRRRAGGLPTDSAPESGAQDFDDVESGSEEVDELDEEDLDEDDLDDDDLDEDDRDDDEDAPADPPQDRATGPFDVSEAGDTEGYLDFGGLLVLGVDGLELNVEVDNETGAVMLLTFALNNSSLQVQAFAAPKSSGIWAETREELAESVKSAGGTSDVANGSFGKELIARVPGQLPDGSAAVQTLRFVGVDGPRWFLRGMFSGAAATNSAAAEPLESVFRSVVVVRGSEAMAPGDGIPMRLPVAPGDDSQSGRPGPDLNPFARGPEITEIR